MSQDLFLFDTSRLMAILFKKVDMSIDVVSDHYILDHSVGSGEPLLEGHSVSGSTRG